LLGLPPARPEVLHCHNLHGDYFDLRELAPLSQRLPVFLSLHDAWLLSGHCSHSFACDRWRAGCGACPDLNIPPAIQADGTAYNWRRKRAIYRRSRLYVATPCRWLMDKVQRSILADGIVEARVIPYGIDLEVFHASDKAALRARLGLPPDACVIFFASNYGRYSYWKDFPTMQAAVELVAERVRSHKLVFLALGDNRPETQMGQAQFRSAPFERDPRLVAQYYQSADIYLHAARADTFPNVVLEASACGVPVVATAVGGIPEQVLDGVTGLLAPERDVPALAAQIERLVQDEPLRRRLGEQAQQLARQRYDLGRFVQDYLGWFAEALHSRPAAEGRPA
jgi:glycosyltransferase involved in cell wall biosynthesis